MIMFSTLDRYIISNVIRTVLLVALLLVTLFWLILLIEELDSVGTGTYTWQLALKYVLLQTPRILLDLASFISLVGTIIALGVLGIHNEIVAMESLSMGVSRILAPLIAATLLLMAAVLLIAQIVLPKALQTAHVERELALANVGDTVTDSGYWSQENNTFLHVRNIRYGRIPADIDIYQYDEQYQLVQYIHADSAEVVSGKRWILKDASLKNFRQQIPFYEKQDQLIWNSFLNDTQLGIILTPAEALSLTNLYQFVEGLKARGEQSFRYELILWERLLAPVSTALMVLLGAQLVFGSTRSFTIGQRITVAVLTGLFFYFIGRVTSYVGLASGMPPLLIAMIPIILMLVVIGGVRVIFSK